jgi:hypothetical protein
MQLVLISATGNGILAARQALTPALRATPLPRAGEGQGVRAFGALQGQKTAKHSNVLSAVKRARGRGAVCRCRVFAGALTPNPSP